MADLVAEKKPERPGMPEISCFHAKKFMKNNFHAQTTLLRPQGPWLLA
ncbi:hypothetical protein [Uliginosibacterium sp. TH139]|nr:hypothetical protein [Uliginosibacterium sp. TH139]